MVLKRGKILEWHTKAGRDFTWDYGGVIVSQRYEKVLPTDCSGNPTSLTCVELPKVERHCHQRRGSKRAEAAFATVLRFSASHQLGVLVRVLFSLRTIKDYYLSLSLSLQANQHLKTFRMFPLGKKQKNSSTKRKYVEWLRSSLGEIEEA